MLQKSLGSSTDPSWAGGRPESWLGEFQDTQMFALQNLLKITSIDTRYTMDTLQMLYLSSTDPSWAEGRLESWPGEFQDTQLLTLLTLLKITWINSRWTIYRNVVEDFPEIHLDQEDPSILDQFLEGKRHFFGSKNFWGAFWDPRELNLKVSARHANFDLQVIKIR